MLAHYHGNLISLSEFGRSLEVGHNTINSYLNILNPSSKNVNGNGLYKIYRWRRKMVNGHLSGWWCNWVVWVAM